MYSEDTYSTLLVMHDITKQKTLKPAVKFVANRFTRVTYAIDHY